MEYTVDELVKYAGVYQIRIGALHYVGKSKHVMYRLGTHLFNLKAGIHPNPLLQSAFNHYGDYEFNLLERVINPSSLSRREDWWIRYQARTGKWLANKDLHGRDYGPDGIVKTR